MNLFHRQYAEIIKFYPGRTVRRTGSYAEERAAGAATLCHCRRLISCLVHRIVLRKAFARGLLLLRRFPPFDRNGFPVQALVKQASKGRVIPRRGHHACRYPGPESCRKFGCASSSAPERTANVDANVPLGLYHWNAAEYSGACSEAGALPVRRRPIALCPFPMPNQCALFNRARTP